jgi:hypothetical protein
MCIPPQLKRTLFFICLRVLSQWIVHKSLFISLVSFFFLLRKRAILLRLCLLLALRRKQGRSRKATLFFLVLFLLLFSEDNGGDISLRFCPVPVDVRPDILRTLGGKMSCGNRRLLCCGWVLLLRLCFLV